MRILVSGATGFIGSHLLPHTLRHHEVFALCRRDPPTGDPITWIKCDLENFKIESLPLRMDGVIHLAQGAYAFPDEAEALLQVNSHSTARLLEYARRSGVQQFILASSGDVYGQTQGMASEDRCVQPSSFYGATKAASEFLALAYSAFFKVSILRLFHPFGPGQRGRLIPKLVASIREQQAIRVYRSGGPLLTPLFISDVASAVTRVLDGPWPEARASGIWNIAGDQAIPLRELSLLLGDMLGHQPVFIDNPESGGDFAGANLRFKSEMGWQPRVQMREGLTRVLEGLS